MDGTVAKPSFIFNALGKIVGYISPITAIQEPMPVASSENVAAAIASASPTNPSAANIVTWNLKISGAQGAGFNIQLPTAAQIIAALTAAMPLEGTAPFAVRLRITNVDTTQTATVLTGAGITLSGTMTIATATVREFDLVVTSPTTITITNAGATAL